MTINTKGGIHVTTGPRPDYKNLAPKCRIIVTKLADAAVEAHPDTFVIYRPGLDVGIYVYGSDRDENIMPGFADLKLGEMRGQAEYWWPKILAAVEGEERRLNLTIDVIQPLNEADGDDPQVLLKLIAYETRLLELAKISGRRLVFGSYAPNSPHFDLWKEYCAPFIHVAWGLGGIYGRHVYFRDPDDETRLQREMIYLAGAGNLGPVAVTEWGYVTFPGNAVFMVKLKEWDSLLQSYRTIGGFVPFTVGKWDNASVNSAVPEMIQYYGENPFTKWEPDYLDGEDGMSWEDGILTLPGGKGLLEKLDELEARIASLEISQLPSKPLPKIPPGHNYLLGVDVSRYQKRDVDWKALATAFVSFVFVRLGSGYTPKDDNFDWNWEQAGLVELLRGAYWYLYPDAVAKVENQATHFAKNIPDDTELPPVVDVEQSGLTSGMVRRFVVSFTDAYGYPPIIYTGAWYWVPNMGANQTWANEYDLWVANYLSGTGTIPPGTFKPRLPDVWYNWRFWQWTSTGGKLVGQKSVNLDLNYFNGTPQDLVDYSEKFKKDKGQPQQPPPPLPSNKVDTLPYLKGNGVLYEVKNERGSQERFQTQVHGDRFWQTKNDKAECLFEKDGYIYRDWDLSPGGNRFYRLLENGVPGSAWIPRHIAVGESFTRSRRVQFYNWDCVESPLNSGNVTDEMLFVAKHDSYTFKTGITLSDVIELLWTNGMERYFYGRGYGLVAWERGHDDPNTPKWSAISEIHAPGQRPNNAVKLPPCLI